MKKRIISLLLTVLMVLSLFSGLTVNAYAATTAYGANTIEYTMGQGDYVLRICQKLGLNYYTCKDAIQILNNIYDGQWNKLAVGRVLVLPASDADAVLIANGARQTATNTGAAATTLSTTPIITGTATTGTYSTANTATFNAGASAAASADTLNYYLVPYTMSYGETVSGVCNNLGVNFSIFSPFIKQVNNISDWRHVRAGDTILVPTPVCPSVGTTCYGVMQHIVKSSDTAYGIVSSKGISYNANERLLKVLNQTDNLAALKAGGNFFYPVPLTVSVPGTGNPGSTATTTTTTTVTDGNGTTTTQTTTTAKLYKLTSGMAASDGTMLFFVNNQAVTAAPAGAKVTVLTSANSGKAVQSLVVKNSDGTADIHMTGDTFIMPGCDVRVEATIKGGHDITINANYSGKAAASVNGISVQAAVKGAAVVIKSADPNYEISAVYASYKKLVSASTKTALTVSSSNAFIMPDADVDVEVILKPVSTYAFYVNDPANGSFYLQVNGSSVTRAAKGTTVTVVAKPDSGYEAVSLKVYKHSDSSKIVNVFSNTFTMPAFDVDVEVEFAGKGNNILIMPAQIATVLAFDEATYSTMGKATQEDSIIDANSNEKVYLVAGELKDNGDLVDFDEAKYSIKYEVKRNSDGLMVKTSPASGPLKNAYVFTMPKGGVTVTPIITLKRDVTVSGEIYRTEANGSTVKADGKYLDCSFSVTYQNAGNEKRIEFNGTKAVSANISALEYVDLRYDNADGVAFIKYKVEVTGAEEGTDAEVSELLTNEANLHGYFQIPLAKSVLIKAYFETGEIGIGQAAITGVGTVGYLVNGSKGTPVSSATCAPGDTVTVLVKAGNGYAFDHKNWENKLIIRRKDNGAVLTSVKQILWTDSTYEKAYTFTMPAEGVDIQAIFDAKPFTITMRCQDETGKPFTGTGIWQIAINMVVGAVDLQPGGTTVEVAYEDYITVAMTESGWSKYDMVSFRIDGKEYTADELNYFYNFQMIGERAKDLDIVAIIRPRVPYSVAIHNLSAIYDQGRGGVQFLILDSETGYSREYMSTVSGNKLVSSQYVNKACTGDKVAIAATVYDGKYTVKKDDVVINSFGGDETRIVVNQEFYEVDGKTVPFFTFIMPDSDVIVSVPFNGTQYQMSVVVTDADGKAVSGMVNLMAGVQNYNDVAANDSFGKIEYNTLITILRSQLCIRENMVVTKVDVQTNPGKTPVYYYNYSANSGGNGPSFNMPASDVIVYITVDDFIPNTYYTFQSQLSGGTVEFHSGPSFAAPKLTSSDIAVGDEIYVLEVPAEGKAHLGKGDLRITNNGLVYTAANWVDELSDGTNVWKLKVPAGVTIFSAVWGDEGADVDTEYGVYALNTDGGTLSFFKEDASTPTLKFTPGKNLYIKAVAKDGYKGPDSKEDIEAYDENGNKLTVKEDSKGYYIDGADLKIDTGKVFVSVNFEADDVAITFEIKPDGKTAELILSDGRSAEFSGSKTFELPVGMKVTAVSATDGYEDLVLTANAGNIDGNVFTVPNKTATVTVTLKEAANPIKWTTTNGSLDFTNLGTNTPNILSAGVGEKIQINGTPDKGYKALARENFTVTKVSDGSVVEVKGSGTATDPWYFFMPAGGVNVDAVFETKTDAVKVKFTAKNEDISMTMSGVEGTAYLKKGESKEWVFPVGTVVTVERDDYAYDTVEFNITKGKGTVKDRTFTVGTVDTEVEITLSSSVTTIDSKVTGGSIYYYTDSTASMIAGDVDEGTKVYLKAEHADGYGAADPVYPTAKGSTDAVDKLDAWEKIIKITKKTDGSTVKLLAETLANKDGAALYFVMPAGGVDVKLKYTVNTVTVTINYTDNSGLDVTAINAQVTDSDKTTKSYVVANGKGIPAKIGDVITLTPNVSGAVVSKITPSAGAKTAVTNNYTYTVPGLKDTKLTLDLTIVKQQTTWSYFSYEADAENAAAEPAENYEAPVESAEDYEAPAEPTEAYEAPVESAEAYEEPAESAEAYEAASEPAATEPEAPAEAESESTEAQGEQPEA